jgi:hydroxymethylbilane synthase
LPAAGQGAIAVQIRSDDDAIRRLLAPLDDAETTLQVTAERAFLAALEGGCQVPIGALAVTAGEGTHATLHGFIADVQGRRVLRGEGRIDRTNPAESGRELARSLRARGALDILDGLRRTAPVPSPQPE